MAGNSEPCDLWIVNRVSQRVFVQFAEVVLHDPVIQADGSVDQTTDLGWAHMPRGRELNR